MAAATVTVDAGSERKARLIVEALMPEAESTHTSRSRMTVKACGGKVTLVFKASDISALRASMNSFCRWVDLLDRALEELEAAGKARCI